MNAFRVTNIQVGRLTPAAASKRLSENLDPLSHLLLAARYTVMSSSRLIS